MHEKKLCAIDEYWCIDRCLIDHSCAEQGAGALKVAFFDAVLPSPERPKSMETSQELAKEFRRRGRFAWAPEATRSEIEAACKLIDGLVAGHPPGSMAASTGWMQRVYNQVSYYISWEPPVLDEAAAKAAQADQDLYEEDDKILWGAKALQKKFEEIKQVKPQEKLKLKDYQVFATFRHLLTREMAADVDARIAKLVDVEAPKASRKSKQSKAAPSKPDAGCRGVSLANELLGL